MKCFLVDSIAAVIFFTLLAGVTEIVVAGMALEQVLAARLAAIPITLATGRPYGMWRDAILRFGRAEQSPRWRRTTLDVVAFLTFQVPVYVLILSIAGASVEQMARAVPTACLLMLFVSRPYGLYLDFCRGIFGIERQFEALN